MKTLRSFFGALSALALSALLAGCPQPANNGDGGTTDGGNNGDGGAYGCSTYCSQITTNCTGDNTQYASMADCMQFCAASNWPAGMTNDMSGNTLVCRVYHSGSPVMT